MCAAKARLVCRALSAFTFFVGLYAGPATASVLEIGDDGSVTVYDGPNYPLPKPIPVETPAVSKLVTTPPVPLRPIAKAQGDLAANIHDAGVRSGVSPALVEAVAWAESRFNVSARSPKGALGVMQLMPSTAAELGVDPRDVAQNVRGGAAYLRAMLTMFAGDLPRALAAYNAGPGTVQKFGGVPPYPETQAYVAGVLERLANNVNSARGLRQ